MRPIRQMFAEGSALGAMRYEPADYECVAIEPMLPNRPRGVPPVDDSPRVLNGIFWVLRSGASWRSHGNGHFIAGLLGLSDRFSRSPRILQEHGRGIHAACRGYRRAWHIRQLRAECLPAGARASRPSFVPALSRPYVRRHAPYGTFIETNGNYDGKAPDRAAALADELTIYR
jgi:hypothetical protein